MIDKVINIAKLAGVKIMDIYKEAKFDIEYKDDNSPITKADKISHQTIVAELKKISSYPIMSEEDIIDYDVRKKWNTFWLIDPLDGTKDFIAKNGEFTVNIALVQNHQPLLGVVYVPASQDAYYATLGRGAYKNGVKIYNHSRRVNLIAADSNFYSTCEMKDFFHKYAITDIRKIGSSLKICQLAEGIIDVYPRLNETKEWDTAATHIIANEAGCKLIDVVTKEALVYNKKNYRNNFFIASRNDLEFME